MATQPAVINPAVLNALTLKYGRDRANLEDQENRYRINYNSAMDKMRRTYDDTELSTRENLSDRGILHSGPALAKEVKLRDLYNTQQGEAAQGLNTNLATAARRKLEVQQEYDINKILASLGLSA